MNAPPGIPDLVATLWMVTLVLGYLLLPVAVYWLHSLWRAASSIRRYAADSAVAAEHIRDGAAALPALDATLTVATDVLSAATAVGAKLDTMAGTLDARSRRRS